MEPTLHLPYAPQLDSLNIAEIANALEECGTRFSVEHINWPEQYPYRPLTVVTAAHSGTHIYIDFLVRCNFLRAVNYADNSPVSEDSCVEFFIEPKAGEPYYNIEMNCIGTILAGHRRGRNDPDRTRLSSDELKRIRRHATVGTRPFEEIEGSFIWCMTTAIPLDLIGLKYDGTPIETRGNFYKCASATSQPHYLSWAPITSPEPDFHRPEFFGKIILD